MADFLDQLRFPAGLDEGDLIAYVESEPLAAAKRAAIAAWIAREPRLGSVIDAMRADRRDLLAMGDEPAPAGLLEAVAAQLEPFLERQMLLGLADGSELNDRPPVSVVRPIRGPFFGGRRLAMAAGLLLLIGGSTYFLTQALTPAVPTPGRQIARAEPDLQPLGDPPIGPTAMNAPSAAETGEIDPESPMSIAAAELAPPPPEAESGESPRRGFSAALVDPLDTLAAADIASPVELLQGPPLPEAVDAVRAAELAREGRLVIRVLARERNLLANPDRIATRLRRAQSSAWVVEGEAAAEIAAMIAQPFPSDTPSRVRTSEPVLIAGDSPSRYNDFTPLGALYGPPEPALAEIMAVGPTVYSLQTRVEPATLDRIKQILAGAGGDVVFEECPETIPGADAPALTVQSMLWWGYQPEAWTGWARVPVVVDVAR